MGVTQTRREPLNWFKAFGFTEDNFAFQMAWALGQTYDRQGDVAEIMATCYAIKDGSIDSWYEEWLRTADRVFAVAERCEARGHLVSAGEAYHRASNYYRTAEFYLHAEPSDSRALGAAAKAVESFRKMTELLEVPVEVVAIPYEETTLPGYFYRSSKAAEPAPLLIVHTGFDGTAEELYGMANAAVARGYHCLVFDGPGQGQAVRTQGLAFRPDWERVITAAVDFALARPGVDDERLAVLGISFGGWLVARAACFEHRPAVYIANPGAYSFASTISAVFPEGTLDLLDSDPDGVDARIRVMCQRSVALAWGMNDGVWKFGATSTADFVAKVRDYALTDDLVAKITSHMLIVDSEGEGLFSHGQARRLYDALPGHKDFLLFTIDEAAEAHCQIAACSVLYQRTFDWLDERLCPTGRE